MAFDTLMWSYFSCPLLWIIFHYIVLGAQQLLLGCENGITKVLELISFNYTNEELSY